MVEERAALRSFATAGASVLQVERTPSPAAAAAAARLSQLELASFDDKLSTVPDVLRGARAAVGAAAAKALAEEIEAAVSAFRVATGSRAPRAFFGVVTTDQCRKFHVDYIAMRLVMTLYGPGTEWVVDDGVDRAALAKLLPDPDASNRAVVKDASAVRRCKAGDWLFMKGNAWPGREGLAAVHRSPPIEQGRLRRVVFVLTLARTSRQQRP